MSCEAHREALTEAAAAGVSVSSPELSAHLDACDSCRAWFEAEQQLFAAIDSGVGFAVNAEAPASLPARVRACLDEQRMPRRSWLPAFAAFAVAALVFALVGLFVHRLRRETGAPAPAVTVIAHQSVPAGTSATAPATAGTVNGAGRPAKSKASRQSAAHGAVASIEVSVLVPAGQKEAVDAVLMGLRKGTVKPDALIVVTGEHSVGDELPPLSIPAMEIKPLARVSEEPAPANEPTNEPTRF
jgi:predicted anti-sigma-YlaC factor YlaD